MEEEFEDVGLGLRVSSWGDGRTLRRFGAWREFARAWAWVQREYWRQSNDCGWWNSERSNVSLFSNAIWRKGGAALQEYPDEVADGPSAIRHGRPDLYFVHRGREFIAEAKQCWPLFTTRVNAAWLKEIRANLSKAIAEAPRNGLGQVQCVALSFSGLRVRGEDAARSLRGDVRDADWSSFFDPPMVASGFRFELFPVSRWKRGREVFEPENCRWTDTNYYPGCILMVGFLD